MEEDRRRKRKDVDRDDDDYYRERRSKKARSRSKSSKDRDRPARRRIHSNSPENKVKHQKHDIAPQRDAHVKNEAPERKTKETDMLNTRTGGAYIPPARLRMMQAQITDKSSVAYQRLAWEALKKSIHGHINKINVGNIGIIIKELLKENIVRGRGLLCRSVIQAQAASPTFTNVYAALVAAVNSRFPNIGELLLKRLVIQFKRGFKRNDKAICISSASFIAHLVNQRVAHEILALELLTLLVETPTDDSVEVSIAFLKECGQKLTEVSSKGVNAIFEMLRNILHEGQLDKRVQYMIEVMFQVWKDGFKDHPSVIEELELVPEEEQFTHLLMLDEATDSQDILNVFKFDDKYEENEQKYKNLSKEILGSDAESGEEGSRESGSEESDEDEEESEQKPMMIIDNTETNLIALRRTIYLTINSSLDFEECAHKLMKMQLKPGQEVELCHMFLDCCAEQRTYEKFYGLLAQRFCNINRMYIGPFEEIFKDSYSTAHRLDTNRLRNVSKFFAHLFFTDSISWEVLECVKLNEEDTTSSSRIYIKILFQELAEYMGLKKLNDRLKDPTLQGAFAGVFPRDNPKNTRFSINFFTSIGLGGLTDELREHLKQMPKNVPPPVTEITVDSSSESSSSSSSSSSSDDSSSSESEKDEDTNKKKKKSKQSKENEQKTAEVTDEGNKAERWGHDGFYDTYGKDARRHETDRDKDNFVKPRDVPKRNDNGDRYRDRDRYWEDNRRHDGRSDRDRHFEREDNRRINEDNRRNEPNNKEWESKDKNKKEKNDDSGHDRRDRNQRNEKDGSRRNKEYIKEKEDEGSKSIDLEKHDEEIYRKNKYQSNEKDDRKSRDQRVEKYDYNKSRYSKNEKDYISKTSREERNNKEETRKVKEQRNEKEDDSSGKRDQRKDREDKSGRDKRSEKNDSRQNKHHTTIKDDDKIKKHRASDKESSARNKSGRNSDESDERSENKGNENRINKKKEESSKNKYDSGYESKKRDKENKNELEDRTKSKKNKDKTSESDESEEEEKKSNKRKESKKDRKEKHRDKKSSKNIDCDDWDIKRASSVRIEPTGRYWDNYNLDKLNEFTLSNPDDKSPDRKKR